ncbi:MAG: hypothetical protein HC927_06580 [Deltaproteobacteria bacterium]|nr:hypothetical protein [Deltaproteobacteria bacterium]
MSLPKRGARRIVVDDVAYRWSIRRQPTYAQGAYATSLSAAVEHEDSGRVLMLFFPDARPDNWLGAPGEIVRPADVAAAIRRARELGWDPADSGAARCFRIASDRLE